jgi:glycosyltransferase involved in cell wall biosynthesis
MSVVLGIAKIYNKPGFSVEHSARELAYRSVHRFFPTAWNKIDYTKLDIVIISNPNISYSDTAITIPQECRKRGIKVIGLYSDETAIFYHDVDLIVTISPQMYLYAKSMYKDIPVIFLPEGINLKLFDNSFKRPDTRFVVGFAGRNKPCKRINLLKKLKYPVRIQSDTEGQFFPINYTLAHMKAFYESIDVLVNLSTSETLCRPIMEAIASGLPVIATEVGATRLLIPDEYLVPAYPEEKMIELVNKKLDLLHNSLELKEGLGRLNRVWAEKIWDWENIAPLWDEMFYYLGEGNFERLEEMSDSLIGSFAKFFKPCPLYDEQIKNLSTLKVDLSES